MKGTGIFFFEILEYNPDFCQMYVLVLNKKTKITQVYIFYRKLDDAFGLFSSNFRVHNMPQYKKFTRDRSSVTLYTIKERANFDKVVIVFSEKR